MTPRTVLRILSPNLSEDRGAYAEAEGFVLVDAQGWPRALLALDRLGMPSLRLLDGSGAPRLILALEPGGTPSVSLRDRTDATRVAIVGDAGDAAVSLYGADGELAVEVAVDAAGRSAVRRERR